MKIEVKDPSRLAWEIERFHYSFFGLLLGRLVDEPTFPCNYPELHRLYSQVRAELEDITADMRGSPPVAAP